MASGGGYGSLSPDIKGPFGQLLPQPGPKYPGGYDGSGINPGAQPGGGPLPPPGMDSGMSRPYDRGSSLQEPASAMAGGGRPLGPAGYAPPPGQVPPARPSGGLDGMPGGRYDPYRSKPQAGAGDRLKQGVARAGGRAKPMPTEDAYRQHMARPQPQGRGMPQWAMQRR